MKIAIGCDHAAFEEKNKLVDNLNSKGILVEDFGCHTEDSVDYPDYAHLVCQEMQNNNFDFGILICGSGIGISIAANKNKDIRAALCTSEFHAEMSRKHNNANIIAFGARVTSIEAMVKMTAIFLNTDFEGGRHQKRIEKIEL
tara:strand:+ start:1047 stop:1475 length:429 start_codon:yes stop_codon:yes gene_type:complete